MPSLTWTPRALTDLDRLHRFLAGKNPAAARQAVHAIRQGARTLAAHPAAGRPAGDMDPEFREWWIPFGGSGYLVLYRLDGPRVVILAVRHGRELGF